MKDKWKIYFLTFFTYSLIHSIRTAWSSIKPNLNKTPFFFSVLLLGKLDMLVLLSLAIGLNAFGWMAAKWDVKRFLLGGMFLILLTQIILAIILFDSVQKEGVYFVLYGLIGLFSCVGWPSCFYIVSKYFSKKDGIVLCIWNCSSQFGDIIALVISSIVVSNEELSNNQICGRVILVIASLTLFWIVINIFFLHPKVMKYLKQSSSNNQQPVEAPPQLDKKEQQFVQEKIDKGQEKIDEKNNIQLNMEDKRSDNSQSSSKDIIRNETPVNFANVWCLPSVTPLVIAFSMIKAVNSIIVNWLVYYLALLELKRESRVITIAWIVSIVTGGIVAAKVNKKLNRRYFIGALLICSVLFIGLQQMHVNPSQFSVMLLIFICGFLFGGPYNLLSTAVPLMLGEHEEIKHRKGAMAAIVSVMEGGAQFVGAIFMIIIPSIGLIQMHWVPAILSFLSAMIITFQQFKSIKSKTKKKNSTQIQMIVEKKPTNVQ